MFYQLGKKVNCHMETPLVSIIVPVFNVEEYISECIESIQRQSYQNIQIILVDDGSTDRSGAICDKYAAHDQRIEVVHKKNGGLVSARKAGLLVAKGLYIGFVDGDDYIEPDMYYVLVEEMETGNVDFVHSGYWENNSKKILPRGKAPDILKDKKGFLETAILGPERYITPSIWSKLFKADLIKKSINQISDRSSFGEDVLALCICVLESKRMAIMGEAYYHYRIRKGSLSHKNDISDLKNVFRLYEDICELLSRYGIYDNLKKVTDVYLWNGLLEYMSRAAKHDFQIARCYFNNAEQLDGKKVVIYGAGAVGRDYYAQISRYSNCRIAAWVDAYPEKYSFPYINLQGSNVLPTTEFDTLIIAVEDENLADEIRNQLIESGIEKSKIHWEKPKYFSMENTEIV